MICYRAWGEESAPSFRCFLWNVRLLVTAVDAFLNREAAAIRSLPHNLRWKLDKDLANVTLEVTIRRTTAELRQVSFSALTRGISC